MTTHEIRTTRIAVVPRGEPIYELGVTDIEIDDDCTGESVKVSQEPENGKTQTIRIYPEEWPVIRKAINRMVRLCRPEKKE